MTAAALTLGPAPAVVGLVNVRGMVFCTGALISTRVVLTAAHCLVQNGVLRWPHAVYAGADARLGGVYLRVQGGSVHPAYDPFLHTADLALLRLADVDDDLTPLKMLFRVPAPGDPVRLVGFGASADGPAGRQHTHPGAVTMVARDFFRFSPGSCLGDSGGPLLASAQRQEGVTGVTSMSDASCATGRAVSLASYGPWLTTTTMQLDSPSCRSGDGHCGPTCPFGDTDCPCREDGVCQLCRGADPDCSDSCVSDGDCVTDCLAPDPDCHAGQEGAACTTDAECASALCASGRCRSRCGGNSGATCPPWQSCTPLDGARGGACLSAAARSGGCVIAAVTARGDATSLLGMVLAIATACAARRRSRPLSQETPNRNRPVNQKLGES